MRLQTKRKPEHDHRQVLHCLYAICSITNGSDCVGHSVVPLLLVLLRVVLLVALLYLHSSCIVMEQIHLAGQPTRVFAVHLLLQ